MKIRSGGLGRGLDALIPAPASGSGSGRPDHPATGEETGWSGGGGTAAPTMPDAPPGPGDAGGDQAGDGHAPKGDGQAPNPAGGSGTDHRAGAQRERVTPQGHPAVEAGSGLVIEVALDDVRPNPRQPRSEFDEDDLDALAASIREVGVLQPVVVRSLRDGGYELVMGERRLRASRIAGRRTVPAIVRETADEDLLRDALLENLHRSDLNPLEEAAAYQELLGDLGFTHEQLGQRLGVSRAQVTNTIRLLSLPPTVQRRVAAGVLSAGHARALLALPTAELMGEIAARVVAEGLSVRATEEIVALAAGAKPRRRPTRSPVPSADSAVLGDVAERLSHRFDTRVQVELTRRKGRIVVEFASTDDLERILGIIEAQEEGPAAAAAR